MKLPKFKDGVQFNGQKKVWAIINGRVWPGIAESPRVKPYQFFFDWHGEMVDKYTWWEAGQLLEPFHYWVEECYSSEQAAIEAQKQIKCQCGQKGTLHFVEGYSCDKPPRNPIAVGIWCNECWPKILKRKCGKEVYCEN